MSHPRSSRYQGSGRNFPVAQRGGSLARRAVRAVDGVSFGLGTGETLGLVGESGSGKSTLARLLVGLVRASGGSIRFEGQEIAAANTKSWRSMHERIQIVFQDPYTSLDPRMTAKEIVAEPLRAYRRFRGREITARVYTLLERVGISAELADRSVRGLSGGQCQRLGIARALALEPRVIIFDEPVSALDVSVQAQVLNLIQELRAELGMSYIFVSHDLSVVQHVADRVAVMYLGKLIEEGTTDSVYDHPSHPYTKALLSAVPDVEAYKKERAGRIVLAGDLPSPLDRTQGCAFKSRCWRSAEICGDLMPALQPVSANHQSSCHFPIGADGEDP